MEALRFEWDPQKARENLRKHRVSFPEAMTVFVDEQALLIPDPGHSGSEKRFIVMGISERLRVLVVCHCYRQSEEIIRIISARKASKTERTQYAELVRP